MKHVYCINIYSLACLLIPINFFHSVMLWFFCLWEWIDFSADTNVDINWWPLDRIAGYYILFCLIKYPGFICYIFVRLHHLLDTLTQNSTSHSQPWIPGLYIFFCQMVHSTFMWPQIRVGGRFQFTYILWNVILCQHLSFILYLPAY